MASTAAARSELPGRGQHQQRREAAEDEERRRERASGVRAEPQPGEERGSEHHDPERHGARVGPGSDGPDRWIRAKSLKQKPRTSRFSFGDAPNPMGSPDARGSRRGPRRVRGRHAASRRRTAPSAAFFNIWVYDGLMVLACVIVGLARVPRAARARRMDGHHRRAALLDVRRDLVRRSSSRRRTRRWRTRGTSRFYVLLYVGIVLLLRSRARSIGDTLWLDGVTAALAAAALGAAVLVDLVLENTDGLDLGGRDEPRLPARRRAPPLGGLRRLLAHRLAARAALARPRPRHPRDDRSPTPSTCSSRRTGRTWRARGSTSSGPPRCCSSPHPRGCPTALARGSRSRAGRSSPYRQSARSSRRASSSTTTSRG